MSFLLTFMESVVKKKKSSAFCCIHSVLWNVYLKVHQMPCLGRQFLWIERGVGGACHCRHCGALEGHPGPLRLLPRHPPQVLVFLQGIVSKFYDCHYWLGKKMVGGRDLPKAFKHNINQSFCSWEKLAVPFLCKDTIKSHFLACQYSYIKKKKENNYFEILLSHPRLQQHFHYEYGK